MDPIIYKIVGIIILIVLGFLYFYHHSTDYYHGGGIGAGGMPPRSAIRPSWGGVGYRSGWGDWGNGAYRRCCVQDCEKCTEGCIGNYDAATSSTLTPEPEKK